MVVIVKVRVGLQEMNLSQCNVPVRNDNKHMCWCSLPFWQTGERHHAQHCRSLQMMTLSLTVTF